MRDLKIDSDLSRPFFHNSLSNACGTRGDILEITSTFRLSLSPTSIFTVLRKTPVTFNVQHSQSTKGLISYRSISHKWSQDKRATSTHQVDPFLHSSPRCQRTLFHRERGGRKLPFTKYIPSPSSTPMVTALVTWTESTQNLITWKI